MFFDIDSSTFLILLLVLVLSIGGVFVFIIIRDFLFLVGFFQERYKISVYNKNFKKYTDEKKRILENRLQKEKEQIEEYGIDYVQEMEVEVIGFIEPLGAHTKAEFGKNFEKYARIAKAAKEGKSLYWQTMIKLAISTGRGKGMER